MKILIINKFFYRRGGSEAYMFDLRDLLTKAGHQVIDFSMKDKRNFNSDYSKYFIKNIELGKSQGLLKDIPKGLHVIYSLEAKRKLEQLIRNEKPDLIHLHNFNFQLSPSILRVIKKHKIPAVWTLHDYKIICPNQLLFTHGNVCERCKIHRYYNTVSHKCIHNNRLQSLVAASEMYLHKLILKSYEAIDVMVAPSKFLGQKIKDWKIPAAKIKQLYYFIDPDKIKPANQIGQDICYIGRLSREKGILTLLEAMKALPGIKLQIIGEGPQKKIIGNYIRKNKLDNVVLWGYKNKEQLLALAAKSRLVIVPSIWYENNPVVILEAFALGKPVIGSNLGGIPEVVKDEKTGFVFKAGDAKGLAAKISQVYNNEALIAQMGKNCRVWVEENCDPQKHLEEIMKIYNKVLK